MSRHAVYSYDVSGKVVTSNEELLSYLKRKGYTLLSGKPSNTDTMYAVFASSNLTQNTPKLKELVSLLTEKTCSQSVSRGSEGHLLVFWSFDKSGGDGPMIDFISYKLKSVTNAALSVVPSTSVQEVAVTSFFEPDARLTFSTEALITAKFSKEFVRLCENVHSLGKFFWGILDYKSTSIGEMIHGIEFAGIFGLQFLEVASWVNKKRMQVLEELWSFAVKWTQYCINIEASKRTLLRSIKFVSDVTDNAEFADHMDDSVFEQLKSNTAHLARLVRSNITYHHKPTLQETQISPRCLRTPTGGTNSIYTFNYREQLVVKSLQQAEERNFSRASLGRVLEESSPRDQRLALLSKKAPTAAIKWQRGRYLGRGATGTVRYCVTFKDRKTNFFG